MATDVLNVTVQGGDCVIYLRIETDKDHESPGKTFSVTGTDSLGRAFEFGFERSGDRGPAVIAQVALQWYEAYRTGEHEDPDNPF